MPIKLNIYKAYSDTDDRKPAVNSRFAKKQLQCINETFYFNLPLLRKPRTIVHHSSQAVDDRNCMTINPGKG
jgi:hypothetical protein